MAIILLDCRSTLLFKVDSHIYENALRSSPLGVTCCCCVSITAGFRAGGTRIGLVQQQPSLAYGQTPEGYPDLQQFLADFSENFYR